MLIPWMAFQRRKQKSFVIPMIRVEYMYALAQQMVP